MKQNYAGSALLGLAVVLAVACTTSVARANVYVTNIKLNGATNNPTVFAGNAVAISYILNEPASSGVTVKILSGSTAVRTLAIAAGHAGTLRGLNTVTWDGKSDAGTPVAGGDYACSITAAATGYSAWTQTTVDSNPGNQVWEPWGLAVNENSNSFYYGRVFVANSYPGPTQSPMDLLGFQKLNADGSPADEGIYSSGGYAWNGSYSESPFRIKVGPDDRFYAEDWSGEGVIMSWDQQISTNSMLNVMTDYNNPGGNLGGFVVTGSGTNAQLWMVDNTTGGYGLIRWNMQADGTLANGDQGTQIIQVGGGSDLDDSAFDIAVDPAGRIYVACEPSSDTQYKLMRFPAYSGTLLTTADWKMDNTTPSGNEFAIAVSADATRVGVALSVSNALLILDASTGTTITNIPVGNPAHAVAWDNVGNAYIAFDVNNAEALWQAWSPPGANQATTVALETIHVLPLPHITGMTRTGSTVTVNFTGPTSDPPTAFVLMSGSVVGGITNNAGASITGSGGTYQATVSSSASAQYYRVMRP
ncbi:MAG TPA: FlgD immunoglobulin-like domain containing protein [Candidatus Acidoferrum sp.]|nr:FlgD immunoglobulin-like domain containing protein [Candidatus Acidoferrum sp.]